MSGSLNLFEKTIDQSRVIGSIVNDIYLLPTWEIIDTLSLQETKLFFLNKTFKANLLHKFSEKNEVEKYSIRTSSAKILANMDLKIYKDSVYIVNLEVFAKNIPNIEKILLKIAFNKAKELTTERKIFINIPYKQQNKNRIKKILSVYGFQTVENQTDYETRILGETLVLYLN